MERSTLTLLLTILFTGLIQAVPESLLYPFGANSSDKKLPRADDISSNEIRLWLPIVFYEVAYHSIYVNNNGHASFDAELPNYQDVATSPSNYKLIAPFLADVDTRAAGKVYFRETQSSDLLSRAADDIQKNFPEWTNFQPLSLVVVTWDRVGYYNQKSDKVNTFQLIVASDGKNSFAFFNYLDSGINWIVSDEKNNPQIHGEPAQARFDSGVGIRHLKLPYSGSSDVSSLARSSNVNIPGLWMYHIGNTEGSSILEPTRNNEIILHESELEQTPCFEGKHTCAATAECVNYPTGFCCKCTSPTYGNGLSCLPSDAPQRMNGKIVVALNKTVLLNLDMHSYVVTSGGRAYTALSLLSPDVGYAVMVLDGLNSFIGWMFATVDAGTKNGFMITGGKLNRSVTVTFQSGEVVFIKQHFLGHDTEDNMRVDTTINGDIPPIPKGVKLKIDDYSEDYYQTAPGIIRSQSSRVYRMDDRAYQYTWEQTIWYEYCIHDPLLQRNATLRTRHYAKRNYVVYNNAEMAVRYIMKSKVISLSTVNPCQNAKLVCGSNADCIPAANNSYTCHCHIGYQTSGQGCLDLNECLQPVCDNNAQCTNTEGSYQCRCRAGYHGDGVTCVIEIRQCGEYFCDDNARCVYNSDIKAPVCECNPGYSGNGVQCATIEYGCNEVDNCAENSQCVYNEQMGEYRCECSEGFSGDGITCENLKSLQSCEDCDPNAQCLYDVDHMFFHCQCKHGFTGDGRTCTTLDTCGKCSTNAECIFEETTQSYDCRCRHGFVGDGFSCTPSQCGDCDGNAQCVPNRTLHAYVCRCNHGYRGDGKSCVPESCNVVDICDVNAECVQSGDDPAHYVCRCNAGFEGSGMACSHRVIPCNQVPNCAEHASCVYDETSSSYRCRCYPGYTGDGLTCHRRAFNCSRNPGLCSEHAQCILNIDHYVCVCSRGFTGNGTVCTPVAEGHNYLMFVRGKSIMQLPYHASENPGGRVLYIPDEMPIAIDSDCHERWFYWTDIATDTIRRAKLNDGLDSEIIVSNVDSAEGIAIDWISRNLYWTDSGFDRIEVARLDGTHRKILFDEDVADPRAIIVDPARGVLYWTDWERKSPRIQKANMDGTERLNLVNTDLGLPNALALDFRTQQLCWGDRLLRRVECIRSDGVGRRILYQREAHSLDIFDMTFAENTLYWTDWSTNTIANMYMNAESQNQALTPPTGGRGRLYGITTVTDQCPKYSNACSFNNGGCSFLCLPTPGGGRTCECPDDIDPDQCNELLPAVVGK